MADEALRTIVCGYKIMKGGEDVETKDPKLGVFDVETKDFILLGVFGIKDIIRQEVPNAVLKCIKSLKKKKNLFYNIYL